MTHECDQMDAYVSRTEFEDFCSKQYPQDAAIKTMRKEKIEKISRYLRGETPVPMGSWRYRIQEKGYTLVNFLSLGLKEVLCLKGAPNSEGKCEVGVFGEWRKVVAVEDFYDVLLEAHVTIQMHGGYKRLLQALETNYVGIPRDAAVKFVSLCSVCRSNPRQQKLRASQAKAKAKASGDGGHRDKVVRLSCITRDFNRRGQVDIMDMSENPDGEYTHVGVFTDHWTKFVILFPLTGPSPQEVAAGITTSVYPFFGPPHFLHCSEGKDFADKVVRLTLDTWKGGDVSVVPRGKPGLLHLGESVGGTRDAMVHRINSRAADDKVQGAIPWARWLGKIMFDINNQPNAATGRSSYSRVFQRSVGVAESGSQEAPLMDYTLHGQKSSKQSPHLKRTEKRKKSSLEDDGNVPGVITSFKTPRPIGAVQLPHTFVNIQKQS